MPTETTLELLVQETITVAEDVLLLTLVDRYGSRLPGWAPGAHIDLRLRPSLIRQYSLCGNPSDPYTWQVAVLRSPESRGGSAFVHDQIVAGSVLEVRGPRNNFPLLPSPRYLFIAGGIGITPFLPMVAAVSDSGAEWTLAYGGRSRSSMAFSQQLSACYPNRVTLFSESESGLIDLDALLGNPRDGTLIYCCGPEGLLQAVEARCALWPAGVLHVERFSPREVTNETAGAFAIELSESGMSLFVPPDKSVLEVLEEAGIEIDSSCREGTCGTCETRVLEGEPDHRDSVLTDEECEEGDVMMVCVSRSRGGRLVLEL